MKLQHRIKNNLTNGNDVTSGNKVSGICFDNIFNQNLKQK
jgi:hypothetical protein